MCSKLDGCTYECYPAMHLPLVLHCEVCCCLHVHFIVYKQTSACWVIKAWQSFIYIPARVFETLRETWKIHFNVVVCVVVQFSCCDGLVIDH